jgi:hypothetical protein
MYQYWRRGGSWEGGKRGGQLRLGIVVYTCTLSALAGAVLVGGGGQLVFSGGLLCTRVLSTYASRSLYYQSIGQVVIILSCVSV